MLKMALVFSGVLALAVPAQAQVNSTDLKWGAAPPVFPAGAQMAVLSGDPSKAGTFVIRLKMPAGYKVPAQVWQYIQARVRQEYPEAIFLLEGLGGPWEATERASIFQAQSSVPVMIL